MKSDMEDAGRWLGTHRKEWLRAVEHMHEHGAAEPAFTKRQLLQSAQFADVHKDILQAIMPEDASYTVGQARTEIKQFMDKAVR